MTARLTALGGLMALLLAFPSTAVFAQTEAEDTGTAVAEEGMEEQVMFEGELARLLVEVLGLAPMLPANPTDNDAFAILLANGVVPAAGWQAENPVTMATLARVLVQAMGRADEVENPEDDASWVDFLAGIGVEFGTVFDALAQAEPLAQPLAPAAIEVSTDPLESAGYIRQTGEQQLGADLQPIRQPIQRPISPEVVEQVVTRVVSAPPAARRPPSRPPMTPN